MASTYSFANPQSRRASRLPKYTCSALPARMAATAVVTLRVTNVPPRRGDSWLNRIPFEAWMPYASRYWTVIQWANTLAIAYGLRGWNGVDSVWGVSATRPYISELPAW